MAILGCIIVELEWRTAARRSMGLIVWDCIHFARQNGITVGPGRGSAAGNLVAYRLNITDTDDQQLGN